MSTLREAFDSAAESNPNKEKVDGALVVAGQTVADAIDSIMADTEASASDKVKALYLVPHLVSILKELLATPAARKSFGMSATEEKKASRLTNIKDAARRHEQLPA